MVHTSNSDRSEGARQPRGGKLKRGEPPVAKMLKKYQRYRYAAKGVEGLEVARERRFGGRRHGACLLQERFPSRALDATLTRDFVPERSAY
jgi:hypothetical protein